MHGIDKIIKQLLDEAKYYRKCYGDRGGCYPPRSNVKRWIALFEVSAPRKAVCNNCLLIVQMSQPGSTYFE